MSDPAADAKAVKAHALAEGFELVGIARAEPIASQLLDDWLDRGFDAGLWYVRDSRDERLDPSKLLPGVKSVVSVAIAYEHDDPQPPEEPHGVVARYARGRDYHNVFNRPLRRLRAFIEQQVPGAVAYASCDTRPVMEKAWAQRAGLGWIGKNGLLIAPPFGSYVLLGSVLTTADLAADSPHPDRCGTCRACLPACPTDALVKERYVDARECLSYHTIEHRNPLPEGIAARLKGRLFGCDLCQEPCPWNRNAERPRARLGQALAQNPERAFVPLSKLLRSSKEELESFTARTPLARAGVEGLQRTAAALEANDEVRPPDQVKDYSA